MAAKMSEVAYLDEFRRERWRQQLTIARETGEVAIFGALQPVLAEVIPFPRPEQIDSGDSA